MAKSNAIGELRVISNTQGREKWVERIASAWNKQLPSIFEVGNLLEAAKEELKHGEWLKMIRDELPFGARTAQKLKKIVQCDDIMGLLNTTHESCLPADYNILNELTRLTPEQFEEGIKSGAINPRMQRKDVKILRGDDPKPKPKSINPKGSSVPLRDRCAVRVRRTVLEVMGELSQDDRIALIAKLRKNIDEIEEIVKKGVDNGHNTQDKSN